MIEHRRYCPDCNGMRTFRGDLGGMDLTTFTVSMTCSLCGHMVSAAMPRAEIEPRLGIHPG